MNDDLLDAVDLLTKDRFIGTWVPDAAGELRVHTEKHPPLLRLLIDGNGFSRRHASSETPIPIDPDALEILAQITDRVRIWCRVLHVAFDGEELLSTLRRWYLHHANRVRSGQVSETIDLEITRTVQSWVRMIENKFEPQEKREWQHACVNEVAAPDEDGALRLRKCGARRIVINGQEQFAIELNVSTLTATCRQCGGEWVGREGLSELRFLTNLDNQIQTGGTIDGAAINLVTNRRK
jgi:hypothetical protein